jgi:D-aminoacyl-tRNA deacylase
MKTVIVCSSTDPAGTNIRDRLIEQLPFSETSRKYDDLPVLEYGAISLVSSKKESIYNDDLDRTFQDCNYIFISRHKAESGIPSLTAHFTGNFGTGDLGGNQREIAHYSPAILKRYFRTLDSLREEIPNVFEITLEATHHGPTSLRFPVLFVELGSGPGEWIDKTGASFVAKALKESLNSSENYSKCAVAFGGPHYPSKFNKFLLNTDFALGPIVPKYSLEYVDHPLLDQIVKKSDQKITHSVFDMKGLGPHKQRLAKLVSYFGLEIIRI